MSKGSVPPAASCDFLRSSASHWALSQLLALGPLGRVSDSVQPCHLWLSQALGEPAVSLPGPPPLPGGAEYVQRSSPALLPLLAAVPSSCPWASRLRAPSLRHRPAPPAASALPFDPRLRTITASPSGWVVSSTFGSAPSLNLPPDSPAQFHPQGPARHFRCAGLPLAGFFNLVLPNKSFPGPQGAEPLGTCSLHPAMAGLGAALACPGESRRRGDKFAHRV